MILATRFGTMWAAINEQGALEAAGFGDPRGRARGESLALATQLREYCDGARTEFQLDLKPGGTEFQQRVWQELCRIPFGSTVTYAELARRVGRPGAARAAGRANATNPIALIIPCHRVLGSNGTLTGYAGGLAIKQSLLEWERLRIEVPCTNLSPG